MMLTAIGCQSAPNPDPKIDLDMTNMVRVHYFERDSMFYTEESAAFFDEADNLKLTQDNEVYHMPLFRFDSANELKTFNEKYRNLLKGSIPENDTPSKLEEATAEMDEAFFDTYTLFAVYVISGSGGYTFYVKDIETQERTLTVRIAQHKLPDDVAVTADMAAWMALIPIAKTELTGYTTFDAMVAKN